MPNNFVNKKYKFYLLHSNNFLLMHRLSKRNEELLNQENRQLQEELGMKREDCESLDNKLQQKVCVLSANLSSSSVLDVLYFYSDSHEIMHVF